MLKSVRFARALQVPIRGVRFASSGSSSLFGGEKPFFVTTPIFYVNASPHIGHLHSIVLADVFARFARLRKPDREVLFSTGTDEHGLKIQQAAAKGGMSEQGFCDDVSRRFRDLADSANISYTDFIRTSEPRHYKAVEKFWEQLAKSGNVYKGAHAGWYSVSDECFYSDKQVEKRADGIMIATETGNEVTWQEEENWKFKLGEYREPLLRWLEDANAVHPPLYHTDIKRQVETATELSISRPANRVKWGVPVPGDPSQTIYVWVDALINYITVAGYPNTHPAWPADLHIVGKDIIRFHALHWPALLSAAGEALPRRVLSHAHWTMHKSKMSKSRGNVADPVAAMKTYGPDSVRWYLMRQGGALSDDADYSAVELAAAYTKLQDQLGNLVSRISSPRLLGKVGEWNESMVEERLRTLRTLREEYEERYEAYELTHACGLLLDTLAEVNKYFTEARPWAVEDGTAAITYAYEALRICGILAQPVMPGKAGELLDRLGVPEAGRGWKDATWPENVDTRGMVERVKQASKKFKGTTLFPRIEE